VSGAAFGFTIANALNKRPVCVRKPGASTHSSNDTEGGLCAGVDEHYSNINFGKCVILDDFISEGGTIERLTNVVGAKNVVAIVLYYKGNVTGSYTTKKMRMIPVINACKMDKVSAAFSKKIKKVSGMGKKMAEETRILAKKNKRPLCISADEI
jgi:orotate phosphoribosyltransferase-like protein